VEGPVSKTFLIIAGAITALFLPFALAFPPTLLEKLIATAALVAIAAGIAALVVRLRRK
jgi:ABC-type transport system involved in cytochrome c biogenesis permease component